MRLVFRAPQNQEELDHLFGLRFAEYADSPLMQGYVQDPREASRFGEHDLDALHLGLFLPTGRPVACLRVVFADLVRLSSIEQGTACLPLLHHFENPQHMVRFVRRMARKRGIVAEAGRFAVAREWRRSAVATTMMECAVAAVRIHMDIPAVLICHPHHQRLYERVGFKHVLKTQRLSLPAGIPAITMAGPAKLPLEQRQRVTRMARLFAADRSIPFDARSMQLLETPSSPIYESTHLNHSAA